jgi:hypothetical protein
MQLIHESGKKVINGIVAVDESGVPVKALLRRNEMRKFYRDNKGYWFKYLGNKFYCDEQKIINEKLYIKIHTGHCLICARLRPETNRCLSPSGFRSFKGNTKEECRYFIIKELNDDKQDD